MIHFLHFSAILYPKGGVLGFLQKDETRFPPSLLYNGYLVLVPGVKRPDHGANHLPPSNAVVKERVELYLFSPLGFHDPLLDELYVYMCTKLYGITSHKTNLNVSLILLILTSTDVRTWALSNREALCVSG